MTTETAVTPELQAAVWAAATGTDAFFFKPERDDGLPVPDEHGWWTTRKGTQPDLLTGDGMLALLEAMRERGWFPAMGSGTRFEHAYGQFMYGVGFSRENEPVVCDNLAPTLPAAVLLAAAAALGVEAAF